MAPTMVPENAHKDIPGNPSTAKSSSVRLSDRSNGEKLRVLTEDDWKFWKHNGYIVIKNAVPKEQVKRTADFLWEFEEKDPNKPVIQDCYIDNIFYRITRVKVEDQKINKTLETIYSDFRSTNNGMFPYHSQTTIAAEKKFAITIDYAKIETGMEQEFPFSIPKNYERMH